MLQALKACWLGALLAAAVACLLPLATWAVQFAVASRQRLGLLLYWAVVLVASLPGMDCLARAPVPTIIVRKVWPKRLNAHQATWRTVLVCRNRRARMHNVRLSCHAAFCTVALFLPLMVCQYAALYIAMLASCGDAQH